MDLPDPRIKLGSPALQGDSLLAQLSGKPNDFPLFSTKVLLVEMRNWLQRSVLPGKRLFYSKSWMTGSKRKLISNHTILSIYLFQNFNFRICCPYILPIFMVEFFWQRLFLLLPYHITFLSGQWILFNSLELHLSSQDCSLSLQTS